MNGVWGNKRENRKSIAGPGKNGGISPYRAPLLSPSGTHRAENSGKGVWVAGWAGRWEEGTREVVLLLVVVVVVVVVVGG